MLSVYGVNFTQRVSGIIKSSSGILHYCPELRAEVSSSETKSPQVLIARSMG